VPLGSNPAAAASANIASGRAIPTTNLDEAQVLAAKRVSRMAGWLLKLLAM
jgi:hypothetical protein